MHNLLENAAKYSPTDSTIDVQLTTDDRHIILRVADQGQESQKEKSPKSFSKDSTVKMNHTLIRLLVQGIGLAIVKMIIEKYHGKITIRDNETKWDQFYGLPSKIKMKISSSYFHRFLVLVDRLFCRIKLPIKVKKG